MSLKVWLPLDGTVENKGVDNITFVSGTPSYDKVGKISANALNLNNKITFDCVNLANLKTFSICFWGMAESSSTLTTNWNDLFGFTDVSSSGTSGLFRWETTYASASGIHWHDNATNALVNGSHNHINVKDVWVHCCVVFDYEKGQIYSYDNGVLTQTHTHAGGHFNSNGRFYLGETNNIEGRINDVRIYDHALSASEVKEIARGLVLHYKLDDINGTKIIDSSGYSRHGTINGAITIEASEVRYNNDTHISAQSQYIKCGSFPTSGFGNSYSFAWWAKCATFSGTMHWGFSDGIRLNGLYNGTLWNTGDSANNPLYTPGTTTQVTAPTTNVWHHFVMTGDGTACKVYKDGVHWATAKTCKAISGTQIYINGWDTSSYKHSNLSVSDFRIYATALSADDILALYKTEAKIPSHSDIHAYAFNEAGSRELLNGVVWTDSYSTHANIPSVNLTNGEYVLTGKQSIGSPYIPISPSGHTYVYDIDVSTDSGNSFYIGFERYDKDKTSRSNNACVYLSGLSGDTSARIHQHYSGTVNLSTDGVNPCAFIALRVLNDWNSPNSRKATVHYISLREVSTAQTPTIGNNGVFTVDELKERQKAAFFKNGFVESTEFIEM